MMTDQPRRVTPAEISELLDAARLLRPGAPLADRIAYHERKAQLLSRHRRRPRHHRSPRGRRRSLGRVSGPGPAAARQRGRR